MSMPAAGERPGHPGADRAATAGRTRSSDERPSVDLPSAGLSAAGLSSAEGPAAEFPAAEFPAAEFPAAEFPAAEGRVAESRVAESFAADLSTAGAPWFERARLGVVRRRSGAPDSPRRAAAFDLAVALGTFAAFTVPELLPHASTGRGPGSAAAIAVLGALAVVPLLGRRRWPVTTLAIVAGVVCAAALVGVRFTPFVSNAGPALAIAAATVASRRPRRESLRACAAAAVATSVAALLALSWHADQDQDAVSLLLVAGGWLVGDALRVRREYQRGLAVARGRERAEHEQRVRAEERLALSRDVHDIVSHTLSLIAVRAGVARHLLAAGPDGATRPVGPVSPGGASSPDGAATRDGPADPVGGTSPVDAASPDGPASPVGGASPVGVAGEALAVIETASRSALDELRRVLRQSRPTTTDDLAARPTLADVPALVGAVRYHGLDVALSVVESGDAGAGATAGGTGRPAPGAGGALDQRPYPVVLQTSVYRVIQEGLTNVARHAAATRAWVEIEHHREKLVVRVLDDGRGQSAGRGPDGRGTDGRGTGGRAPGGRGPGGRDPGGRGPGLGLTGMRERAELLGGTFEAGPRERGGFAVVASFPVAPDEQ